MTLTNKVYDDAHITHVLTSEELDQLRGADGPFTAAGEALGADGRGKVSQFATTYGAIMTIGGAFSASGIGAGTFGADMVYGQYLLGIKTGSGLAQKALYTEEFLKSIR